MQLRRRRAPLAIPPVAVTLLLRLSRREPGFRAAPLVLEEERGPRWLPIWIGTAEARSIALQMEERTSPRPNSHDLARAMIRGLDASVERVGSFASRS